LNFTARLKPRPFKTTTFSAASEGVPFRVCDLRCKVGVSILAASAVEVGLKDEQQIPFGNDNKKDNRSS
jgi:hypothetical protein